MASIRETITLAAALLEFASASLAFTVEGDKVSFGLPEVGKRVEMCSRVNSATRQNRLEGKWGETLSHHCHMTNNKVTWLSCALSKIKSDCQMH